MIVSITQLFFTLHWNVTFCSVGLTARAATKEAMVCAYIPTIRLPGNILTKIFVSNCPLSYLNPHT
jgi:hypothetical protein